MRAARFTGEGRIAIAEVPPPVPAAGVVLLHVTCCALCGSDLRPLRQGWPVTPGHEILGRVDQPRHPWHGRRALVYIPVFCGRCEDCAAGRAHLCRESRDLVGWQRPGDYAERVAVPERCLLPLPDDIPDRLAPLLPLFARARVDFESLPRRARGQFLFGWTPNPGTALYAGYNDDSQINGFSPINGLQQQGFRRNGRTFFIKMSYLIRRSFGG